MALKLPTRQLGRNGPQVTAMGFGMMGLSALYGKPKPDQERYAMLSHVYDAGEHFWDTSDMYADSEDLIGRWFKLNPGKRENVFLATKFGAYMDPETKQRSVRNDPQYVQTACARSRERLGVDVIDLYYVHRVQESQPIEVTMRALKELQDAGKIRYIGLSEVSAATLRRACSVAQVSAVQIEYSPFSMDIEDPQIGLLETCRELGVATVAYAPLGRGFLTGALKSRDDFEEGDFRKFAPRFNAENFPRNLKLVDEIKAQADAKGCTAAQLTLAFLMAQGEDIVPIPGTTRTPNFDENIHALNVRFNKEDNDRFRKAISDTVIHGARYPPHMGASLFADTVALEGWENQAA